MGGRITNVALPGVVTANLTTFVAHAFDGATPLVECQYEARGACKIDRFRSMDIVGALPPCSERYNYVVRCAY